MTPKKTQRSDNTFTVKDLCDKLEVSNKTIKTWEQKKLIPKARRNVFGWRVYSQDELDKTEEIVRKNNFFNNK
jgi:DNA-binding transcriptional MerR regulator